MEKKHITLVPSKQRSKLISGVIPRQLYSPFRSSKVKRSLNYTSQPPLIYKISKFSPIRSRLSPNRALLTDLQPLRALISSDNSTSDSIHSHYNSAVPEESVNVIRTPSTIKEEEPMNFYLIEDSLMRYFNFEINPLGFTKTPMPSMATPDLRAVNRYRNSVNCDFTPYRSETPEIPTRPKDAKETVRLPAVRAVAAYL